MICKGYVKKAPHKNTTDKTTTLRTLIKNHHYIVHKITETNVELTDDGEKDIIIYLPRKTFADNFQLPYCITTHSAIGLTIKNPITLFDWQNSTKKWFWTAITRTTSLSLISFYTGPEFIDETKLRKQIAKKIAEHKAYDIKRGIYDKEDFVDPDWALDQIKRTDWICPRKGCEMTTNGNRQWSIDRNDNDTGHGKHNCRIICLSCNKAKK
jgi:hypothetical protein